LVAARDAERPAFRETAIEEHVELVLASAPALRARGFQRDHLVARRGDDPRLLVRDVPLRIDPDGAEDAGVRVAPDAERGIDGVGGLERVRLVVDGAVVVDRSAELEPVDGGAGAPLGDVGR
jgi:hypothetical protein